MPLYWVSGIRHEAVIDAPSAEDALHCAIASGEVGDWESPEAQLAEWKQGDRGRILVVAGKDNS